MACIVPMHVKPKFTYLLTYVALLVAAIVGRIGLVTPLAKHAMSPASAAVAVAVAHQAGCSVGLLDPLGKVLTKQQLGGALWGFVAQGLVALLQGALQ